MITIEPPSVVAVLGGVGWVADRPTLSKLLLTVAAIKLSPLAMRPTVRSGRTLLFPAELFGEPFGVRPSCRCGVAAVRTGQRQQDGRPPVLSSNGREADGAAVTLRGRVGRSSCLGSAQIADSALWWFLWRVEDSPRIAPGSVPRLGYGSMNSLSLARLPCDGLSTGRSHEREGGLGRAGSR